MDKTIYQDNFLTIEICMNEKVKTEYEIMENFGFVCDISGKYDFISINKAVYIANKLNAFNALYDTIGKNLYSVLKY